MSVLELSSVTLVRRGEKILDSVSLLVGEGEMYLLAGEDPMRLSAALGVAAGRMRPTLGSAVAFGLPAREQRTRIGVSQTNNALVDALPVELGLRLRARSEAEVARALDVVELTRPSRKMRDLAGLDRAKARLARALIGGHKAIVLNDPWRGFSATEGQAFSQLVARICALEGVAALCSTTSPDVAGLFAARYGVVVGPRLAAEKTLTAIGGRRAETYKVRTTRLERDLVLLGESLPGAAISVELDPLAGEKYLEITGCDELALARTLEGLDSITLELSRSRASLARLLFDGAGDQK